MSSQVELSKVRKLYGRRSIFPVFLLALVLQLVYGMMAGYAASAATNVTSVVVNEIAPATGTHDKWIELYNPTSETVDMSGWRFVLNGSTSVSPVISNAEIAPGEFYIYTPNSLTPQSRTLELRTAASNYEVIDTVKYPQLQNGQSYAREADGSGEFVLRKVDQVTKGASNSVRIPDDDAEDGEPEVLPTPEEEPSRTIVVRGEGRIFDGEVDSAGAAESVQLAFYQLDGQGNVVGGDALFSANAFIADGAWTYQIPDSELERFVADRQYRVTARVPGQTEGAELARAEYRFTFTPEVPEDSEGEKSGTEEVPGGDNGKASGKDVGVDVEGKQPEDIFYQIITDEDMPSPLLAQALRSLSTPAAVATSTPNVSFMTALSQATPTPQVQAIAEAGSDEETLGIATRLHENSLPEDIAEDEDAVAAGTRWLVIGAVAAGVVVLIGVVVLLSTRRTVDD